jgi:DNA-binding HxlR family transcriptional regulator
VGTKGYSSQICPRYQAAVDLLGKRWTGLIVQQLLDGPLRFNELCDRIELVSDRMMSERLKELEAAGVVHRQVAPEPPVRVAYSLTEKGKALAPVVSAIATWAEQWVVVPPQKTRRG